MQKPSMEVLVKTLSPFDASLLAILGETGKLSKLQMNRLSPNGLVAVKDRNVVSGIKNWAKDCNLAVAKRKIR